jgi:hypothetical protein
MDCKRCTVLRPCALGLAQLGQLWETKPVMLEALLQSQQPRQHFNEDRVYLFSFPDI